MMTPAESSISRRMLVAARVADSLTYPQNKHNLAQYL